MYSPSLLPKSPTQLANTKQNVPLEPEELHTIVHPHPKDIKTKPPDAGLLTENVGRGIMEVEILPNQNLGTHIDLSITSSMDVLMDSDVALVAQGVNTSSK